MSSYSQYIVMNPDVRFGKPTVKGTRLTVYEVLAMLSEGESEADIITDFPQLTEASIRACLAFAAAGEKRSIHV